MKIKPLRIPLPKQIEKPFKDKNKYSRNPKHKKDFVKYAKD